MAVSDGAGVVHRTEINGARATAADLAGLAFAGYGHSCVWNIGFVDSDVVVWPEAPMLRGTMLQSIQAGLDHLGVASETRPVRRADIAGFSAAFLVNAICPGQPIAGIDDHSFRIDPSLLALLVEAHEWNEPNQI